MEGTVWRVPASTCVKLCYSGLICNSFHLQLLPSSSSSSFSLKNDVGGAIANESTVREMGMEGVLYEEKRVHSKRDRMCYQKCRLEPPSRR